MYGKGRMVCGFLIVAPKLVQANPTDIYNCYREQMVNRYALKHSVLRRY
jgi:hypothetical protein